MAAFNREVNNCSRIDWCILINGAISLYYDEHILQKDMVWLKDNKYKCIVMDFDSIECIESFHKSIKKLCGFPRYYGENMPALSDCLQNDLDIPYESGLAFILKNFNLFYAKDQSMAHDLLERLGEASKRRMLTGDRLIVLLQTDDSLFSPDMVGSYKISWNRHEFIDSKRIKNNVID